MDGDVGAWAVIRPWHPVVSSLAARLWVPNPAYRAAVARGESTRGIPARWELAERDGEWLRVPRGLVEGLGLDLADRTAPGEPITLRSRATLRPEQEVLVATIEAALGRSHGAVAQAPPGFGKTVIALEVIARLARKTLIIVHKEFLLEQWQARIATFLDLGGRSVGIVQQSRVEWREHPIVIAMAQSLLARTYEPELYTSFGLVVVDEVHRFAAPSFHRTIVMFPAARRLGVSATPERPDGLEGVFFAHIGKLAGIGAGASLQPQIVRRATPVEDSAESRRAVTRGGREDRVRINSYLVRHPARNQQIVDILVRATASGRKVLLLSDRRRHLLDLARDVAHAAPGRGVTPVVALYVGGLSSEERRAAESADILLGTYAMAKEGLDIPALDTLVLATPRADVLQAVGRILRPTADKHPPVVVDLVDRAFSLCRALHRKRQREYERLGWVSAPRPE